MMWRMPAKPPEQQSPHSFTWNNLTEIADLPDGGYFPSGATVLYVEPGLVLDAVVGIRGGQPGVLRVTVLPEDEDQVLSAAPLRQAKWQQVFERVVASGGMVAAMEVRKRGEHPPGPTERTVTFEEEHEAKEAALGQFRRRAITDSLLMQVAEVARAHPDTPTKAVQDELHTGHRNATRWIATARRRGFLIDGFSPEQED
jgi:hypothetical protein